MFSSEAWLANPGADFYNGVATQSLRFDDGRNTELTRSPAEATDQKKYTLSCWVKRANLGSTQTIFSAGNSGTGNPGFEQLNFTSGNALRYYRQIGSVGNTEYVTTQLFRDVSAWYNIVVMMDAANTIGYIYVNGVRVTSFSTTNHPTNVDGAVNSTQKHAFGNRSIDGSADFDGYLAEVNFLDGLIVGETSGYLDQFGEVKNGVWIPKAYSGSYGTNGYRLDFADNAVDAPTSEGTEDTDNIGSDSSGEHNNWTSDGIVASDCAMPDSPENNFCTWNGLFRGGEQSSSIAATSTLSEGNLQVSVPQNSYMGNNFRPISGKWYCEFRLKTQGTANGETDWGWFQANTYAGTTAHSAQANKWGVYFHGYFTDHIQLFDETTQLGSNINLNIVAGDVLQLALDIDNKKGWVGINNTWYRTNASDGNPSNGTNQTFTFTADEAQNLTWYVANGTSTDVYVANFGQDSTFGGDETATTNADANGIGAFHHAPPTDFLALCAANLSDDDLPISPIATTQADNHFGTLTYTGDGQSSQNIVSGATDIGGEIDFQPDWVWIKNRTSGYSHQLQDAIRGFVATKVLSTNQTAGEGVASATGDNYGHMSGVEANGFTVTHTINSNNDGGTIRKGTHFLNDTYVAWNWNAGGTTSTIAVDSVESGVPSIASTVRANTTAGFSIVTYTGTGSAGTIGHGLGKKPEHIIFKSRTENGTSWANYVGVLGAGKYLALQSTQAQNSGTDSTRFNGTEPDENVFSVGTHVSVNTSSSHTYVAYCFAEIEGYSKFGSYTGGGTALPFVYTGFAVKYLMMKRTNTTGNWYIWDNTREEVNPVNKYLRANIPNTDGGSETGQAYFDFLSNGFKLRANNTAFSEGNSSGSTHFYMAFASNPFKYSTAQ